MKQENTETERGQGMRKIFKNMVPYGRSVIVILALLLMQAACDLALPSYTSDIIDVGIQKSGVEHVVPQAVTAEEFAAAQTLMTEEETQLWQRIYEQDGDVYRLTEHDETRLAALDDALVLPLIMNYQMRAMEEASFKAYLASQNGMDAAQINAMSIEQIGQTMGVSDAVRNRPKKTMTAMRIRLSAWMSVRYLRKGSRRARWTMTRFCLCVRACKRPLTLWDRPWSRSMGVAYAVDCDKAAGLDVDAMQTAYLWTAGLKMVGLALIMGLATVLVSFFASRVGAGIGRDLRDGVFKRVVGFSNAEMDQFSTASLITRSTNDIQQIQMVSAMLLRMVAYAPIMGIGGVIKAMQTGAGLGWVIALALLVILGYVMVLMSVSMPKFKLMQKLVDRLNLVSREILTGLSVIRAFKREDQEEERFDEANRALTKTMLFTNRVMTFMMPGMMLIMNVLTVAIVWFGAHQIDAGTMQVGAMTAFITYAMMIVMSFLMLTMMSIMLPRAAVAAERIDEVLQTASSIRNPEQPETLAAHNGVLRFNHVSFRYPNAEEDVLHDIDFTATPGTTTAIIGSTGCGKSTLVNLIPRLYDVTAGSIEIDGKDIRKLSMEELRSEIGFVPQKGVLFSGTIASNLRFGNDEATDEEIRRAAKIAQAADFIEEKEEKYDSPIAQGGSNVSGGQKQRLAIARAIAKNPKIFIFDDSFSALDMKTDAALRKALHENVKDSTIILVAQRISTILHAEQILVLDDGRIVGRGTHAELLAGCEVYQQIAKSQLSAKELGLAEGAADKRADITGALPVEIKAGKSADSGATVPAETDKAAGKQKAEHESEVRGDE